MQRNSADHAPPLYSLSLASIRQVVYQQEGLAILSPSLALYKVGQWQAYPACEVTIRALIVEWTLNIIKELMTEEGASVLHRNEDLGSADRLLLPTLSPLL